MKKSIILSFGLFVSTTTQANIYRYYDDTGRAYFSNESHAVVLKPQVTTVVAPLKPVKKKLTVVYTQEMIMYLAQKSAKRHGVDPKLVKAVIKTESSFKTYAISSKGAVGVMQLMPVTAERFGVIDRTDPVQSIEGGTKYIKHLLEIFNNDKKLALAGYNAGENAVIRHNRKIPPYPETINYVSKVLTSYQTFT